MTLLDLELKRKMAEGKLSSIGNNVDRDVSLPAYADDIMIVTKATSSNAHSILEALSNFKKWTGLQVNISKSHIMFSPSINKTKKKEIMYIFQFKDASKWWTHLGIPMNGGQIPSMGFNKIISKIDSAFASWRAKLLSFVGKVVFIKSIMLSIPVFSLAGCKVPYCVIDKIERLIRKFFWSQDGSSNKIHYISWKQISKPKGQGGLGLYKLQDIQKALLGKMLFRLINNRDEPWVDWVLSSYHLNGAFWNQSPPSNLSPLMKEILKASSSIKEGIVFTSDSQIIWSITSNHLYYAKSALRLIRAGSLQNLENMSLWRWKNIWKLRIIPKIKIFLWKLLTGGLPTKNRLSSKG